MTATPSQRPDVLTHVLGYSHRVAHSRRPKRVDVLTHASSRPGITPHLRRNVHSPASRWYRFPIGAFVWCSTCLRVDQRPSVASYRHQWGRRRVLASSVCWSTRPRRTDAHGGRSRGSSGLGCLRTPTRRSHACLPPVCKRGVDADGRNRVAVRPADLRNAPPGTTGGADPPPSPRWGARIPPHPPGGGGGSGGIATGLLAGVK